MRNTRPPVSCSPSTCVCLVDEYFALRSLGDLPVDNLVWEGDFPHGDGLWPDNHEYLEKALADVRTPTRPRSWRRTCAGC